MSGPAPMITGQLPVTGDQRSFARYLRVAARRGRRRAGSGMRYQIVVASLWFGPGVAIGTWQDLNTSTSADSPLSWPAAALLLLAGAAVIGLACVTIGPVTASREWRAWVLSTPLDRGALLRGRAAGVLALLIVPGIVLGAVLADAAGFRHGQALASVLLGAAAAVAAGGLAMWQQRVRPPGVARGRGALFWAAGFSAAGVVADLRVAGSLDPSVLWASVLVSGVIALALAVVGLTGVGLVPLSSLAAGSGSVSSLALALQDQSLAPLAAVLAAAPGRRRTRAPVRPLSGTGQGALVAMDRRRTLRNRPALVRYVAMAAIPYAAWALLHGIGWAPSALVVVTFVAGVAAISGLCSTVRQFAGNPPLAEKYGLARSDAKRNAMLLPRLGALLWGLSVAPVLLIHTPSAMFVIIPLAVLAVVEFRARQGPFEESFVQGQQYSQDLGRRFARGPALLLGGAIGLGLLVAGLQQRNL